MNSEYKMPLEINNKDYKKYIDVDGDEKITSNDAVCVMQKVLNSSYKLPSEP